MASERKVDTLSPPPSTCTITEYHELLSLASSIESYTDAQKELLDCSRHGELDSVRALLDVWSQGHPHFVDTTNEMGCTALHFAAANGHTSIVHLLLSAGASHMKNKSGGNTPLHWAAQNSHSLVIQLLLNHPPFRFHSSKASQNTTPGKEPADCSRVTTVGIDVLEKNAFGRSALTEGFGSRKQQHVSEVVPSSSAYETTKSYPQDMTSSSSLDDKQEGGEDDDHIKMIGMLLEHDSATEDRLIGCSSTMNEEDGGMIDDTTTSKDTASPIIDMTCSHNEINMRTSSVSTTKSFKQNSCCSGDSLQLGVIHEFNFGSHCDNTTEPNIFVRELPIINADSPFGMNASEDTTGLGIWCASLVLSRWLYVLSTVHRRFDDKIVLELGAGCGTPGLTVALYSRAHTVYLTDFNSATMENLQFNINLNSIRDNRGNEDGSSWADRVVALKMDWDDCSTWPTQPIDCIIGSDLIYQKSIVPMLKNIVHNILSEHGSFIYVCPTEGRDGLAEFIHAMNEYEFTCINQLTAPKEYKDNPLSDKDEESAFIHFHELPVTEYILFEFSRKNEK